jgi:hypothetical protein
MDPHEQKQRENQSKQMFDMAEKPIMRYIAAFLDETPEAIFLDDTPDVEDPLILLPMDDYKKDICIKFTLANVGPDYKLDLKNLIEYDLIKEAIGFLYYCVRSVYGSVITSTLINKKIMSTTILKLDEENWVFTPQFIHEDTKKRLFLQETLGKLMHMMKDPAIDDSMRPKINEEYKKVIVTLSQLGEPSVEIKSLEEQINKTYDIKPRLGIFVEEIHRNQLPKPKIDSTKPQQELPYISGGLYSNASKGKKTNDSGKRISRPAVHIDLIKEVSEEFAETNI